MNPKISRRGFVLTIGCAVMVATVADGSSASDGVLFQEAVAYDIDDPTVSAPVASAATLMPAPDAGLEGWLLATGRDALDGDLYATLAGHFNSDSALG